MGMVKTIEKWAKITRGIMTREWLVGCVQLLGDRFHMYANASAAPLMFCNGLPCMFNTYSSPPEDNEGVKKKLMK